MNQEDRMWLTKLLMIVVLATIIMTTWYYGAISLNLISPITKLQSESSETKARLESIEQQNKQILENQAETSAALNGVKKAVEDTKAPEWLESRELRRKLRNRLLVNRGGDMLARLKRKLAGTQMEGMERVYYLAAIEKQIDPRLQIAINIHESGNFRFTPPGSNNYGGIKYGRKEWQKWGYSLGKGGDGRFKYQRFPDKETFIMCQAQLINENWGAVKSPYQMKGYAESKAWGAAVSSQMARI